MKSLEFCTVQEYEQLRNDRINEETIVMGGIYLAMTRFRQRRANTLGAKFPVRINNIARQQDGKAVLFELGMIDEDYNETPAGSFPVFIQDGMFKFIEEYVPHFAISTSKGRIIQSVSPGEGYLCNQPDVIDDAHIRLLAELGAGQRQPVLV